MKKLLLGVLASGALAIGSMLSSAQAVTVNFSQITANGSPAIAGQLSAEVVAGAGQLVTFTFKNNVGVASNISEIYFDLPPAGVDPGTGNTLFTNAAPSITTESAGVDFVLGANPAALPGSNNATPDFETSLVANSSAAIPSPQNGLNASTDVLTLTFTLLGGKTFADDVIDALVDGSLRLGLHVQAIGTLGKSESFVSNPPVRPNPLSTVPLPGAALFLITGLIGLGAVGRMRARLKA